MPIVARSWKVALVATMGALIPASVTLGQSPTGEPKRLRFEAPTCVDVVLGPGGVLRGQVQSATAAPRGAVELVLVQVDREMARTTTDEQGHFQLDGVRGGAYSVASAGSCVEVRLWAEGTAPPAAQDALLLVAGRDVTLGQGAGGTFWRTVTNPWVSAGLIGAAIAVPIALNNNDSGS